MYEIFLCQKARSSVSVSACMDAQGQGRRVPRLKAGYTQCAWPRNGHPTHQKPQRNQKVSAAHSPEIAAITANHLYDGALQPYLRINSSPLRWPVASFPSSPCKFRRNSLRYAGGPSSKKLFGGQRSDNISSVRVARESSTYNADQKSSLVLLRFAISPMSPPRNVFPARIGSSDP